MADQEEEDFKLALRLSMQHHDSPEPERSNSRLRVSVPPKWTSEEFLADVADRYGPHLDQSGCDKCTSRVSEGRLAQHAPLVDCVRTRWSDALCNWEGDAPSIV